MDPKLHDYTVFDLETTGKKIIQIGALKVRDDQTVAKFSTYVNPLEKINEYVSHLTGISNYQTDAAIITGSISTPTLPLATVLPTISFTRSSATAI